jgi:hypothetical protein
MALTRTRPRIDSREDHQAARIPDVGYFSGKLTVSRDSFCVSIGI